MTKRALVTGAAGFVGAHLAERLVEEGVETHLVVRPGSDRWRIALAGLDAPVHEIDITDHDRIETLLRETRPAWIFHLAAHGAYSSQRDLRRMLEVNLLGTMNLLTCAAAIEGVEAFVHTGSSSEYGYVDHAPSEDEPAVPRSHYAVTKLAATLHARAFAKAHRLPVRILRLYSVYGPMEEPTRLVPTLALEALEGRLPPLVDPDVARDFVYVGDVADAYLAAARARASAIVPGTVYNVGTGRQITIRDAVEVVRRELDVAAPPRFGTMPNRGWDTQTWIADPTRAGRELGWTPGTTFEAGFRRFVAWLQERPDRIDTYRRRAGHRLVKAGPARTPRPGARGK